jgi:hypothetical protein
MDELKLYYFVEGQEGVVDVVNISKDQRVVELRDLIHRDISSTLYRAWQLTLPKG